MIISQEIEIRVNIHLHNVRGAAIDTFLQPFEGLLPIAEERKQIYDAILGKIGVTYLPIHIGAKNREGPSTSDGPYPFLVA